LLAFRGSHNFQAETEIGYAEPGGLKKKSGLTIAVLMLEVEATTVGFRTQLIGR
jgi:hypothetical protein